LETKRKGIFFGPYLHGRVLQANKWERVKNCPLHLNLEAIANHIYIDFLENIEIIRVEKQDCPITCKELVHEIENGNNIIFHSHVLDMNLCWES